MAVQVRVDWGRFIAGLLMAAGVVVGVVVLAMHGPRSHDRPPVSETPVGPAPSGGETGSVPGGGPAARGGPALPSAPPPSPTLDWQYAALDWDFHPGEVAGTETVQVVVLDSETPDQTVPRRSAPGHDWLLVRVACAYAGGPSPEGLRLDFGDLRLADDDGTEAALVSVRPVGQDFFKVFDRRAFPPIALDPRQTRADLELLFSVPQESGAFTARRASAAAEAP